MDNTTLTAINALGAAGSASTGGTITIILFLMLALFPVIVKFWNWSKETSASGTLYGQLSELLQKQREELDTLYIQRTILQEQMFDLRGKIEKLEGYESIVDELKQKLDAKDQIISDRDDRVAALLEELLKMKDRVHNLEIRLKADEDKFCEGCTFKEGYRFRKGTD